MSLEIGIVQSVRPYVGHGSKHRRKGTMRVSIRFIVVVALFAALSAFGMAPAFAQGNGHGNGNADNGCVTGNPSPGSECNGGPNDNQGKPGGGVGCAGGSDGQRSEPCGRENGDGTLNNQGNVPGCTSQGNAVNQNPHCGGGAEPPPCQVNCGPPPCAVNCGPPPCETGCTPPPPGGCVSNCGETPHGSGTVPMTSGTTPSVHVKSLPTTGIGTAAQPDSSLLLLLGALSFLAAAIGLQRRHTS